MSERDNPLKQRVSKIIRKITTLDKEYVLDAQYIQWGRVERDLWRIIDDASKPPIEADAQKPCSVGEDEH